jgi:hypothetical protein
MKSEMLMTLVFNMTVQFLGKRFPFTLNIEFSATNFF